MDWGFVAWLELVAWAAQLAAFAILYGARSAWRGTPVGPALLGFMTVAVVALCGFAVLAMAPLPGEFFAALFAVGNAVTTWLLVLLVRAQRRDRESERNRE